MQRTSGDRGSRPGGVAPHGILDGGVLPGVDGVVDGLLEFDAGTLLVVMPEWLVVLFLNQRTMKVHRHWLISTWNHL